MSEWVHGVFKDVSHDSTSWSQSCEYGDWLSAVSECNTWTSPDNKAPEWKKIMCKIYFVMLLTDFEKQNKKEAKIISHIHLPTTALQKPHMLPFDDTCCLQFNFQPLKRVTAQYAGYRSILHEEKSRLRTRFFPLMSEMCLRISESLIWVSWSALNHVTDFFKIVINFKLIYTFLSNYFLILFFLTLAIIPLLGLIMNSNEGGLRS